MIKFVRSVTLIDGTKFCEGYCNTADYSDLPVDGISHGSTMTDVELGVTFLFDEENAVWVGVEDASDPAT